MAWKTGTSLGLPGRLDGWGFRPLRAGGVGGDFDGTSNPAFVGIEAAVAQDGDAPTIASPLRGLRYLINPRKAQPLLLRADAAMGVRTLYWSADDGLLGRTAPGESLAWQPLLPGNCSLPSSLVVGARIRSTDFVVIEHLGAGNSVVPDQLCSYMVVMVLPPTEI